MVVPNQLSEHSGHFHLFDETLGLVGVYVGSQNVSTTE